LYVPPLVWRVLTRVLVGQVVLEAEVDNVGALKLYEGLGFVRDKLLPSYYLSGVSAWRLKLWFT
jgi:ribosomal protein S18 acetylase RimI-like enzyme